MKALGTHGQIIPAQVFKTKLLTWAKKLVVLVGSKWAIAMATENSQVQHLYTALAKRLADEGLRTKLGD